MDLDVFEILPFWDNLSEQEKELTVNSCVIKSFKKGQLIYGDDFSCMGMIIVAQGDIRVSLLSDSDRQATLFHVEEGDCCAVTASCVIKKLRFDTLVEAYEDTLLYVIPSSVQLKLNKNIYVKASVYELLTERFSDVVSVMEDLLFKKFDDRLWDYLMDLCDKSGYNVLTITQDEIASEINSAREVVTRTLKKFADRGLIEVKRGKIIIKKCD